MVEEKDNVYVETEAAHTAEAEKQEGATAIGKFKDVDALMKAYNALQAEFTRRSQRLRALENAVDNSTATAKAVDEGQEAGGLIAPVIAKDEPTVAENTRPTDEEEVGLEQGEKGADITAQEEPSTVGVEQNSQSLYDLAVKDETVRNRIIGEYLTSLQGGAAPLMRGGTGEPAVTRKKAANLSEAGKMALQFFKNGN